MDALVNELAYIAIDAVDIAAWSRFANDVLGFEITQDRESLRFKMDSRLFRYIVREASRDGIPQPGWQVSDAPTLARVSERVGAQGIGVAELDSAQVRERQALGGIRFRCRNGIEHEVVYGLTDDRPFHSPGDVSAFVTAPGGMGHMVWAVPDLEAMDRLMIGAFGMELREEISTPGGLGHFYGCNARHHSVAVVTAPELSLDHVMAEMKDIDDVGRAMDRIEALGYEIGRPLGRHRTDHMLSFYVKPPSGMKAMEIGCGGLLCGTNWSEVRETTRLRPWGHGAAFKSHRGNFEKQASTPHR